VAELGPGPGLLPDGGPGAGGAADGGQADGDGAAELKLQRYADVIGDGGQVVVAGVRPPARAQRPVQVMLVAPRRLRLGNVLLLVRAEHAQVGRAGEVQPGRPTVTSASTPASPGTQASREA
jgi:hypothetical protein